MSKLSSTNDPNTSTKAPDVLLEDCVYDNIMMIGIGKLFYFLLYLSV